MNLMADLVTAEALTVALDCVATPVFLLRADGVIVHLNAAGKEFLRAGVALRQVHGRLVARRSAEAKMLAAVLTRVVANSSPELVRLLSRNGNVSLLITVAPVPGTMMTAVCAVDLHAEAPRLAGWLQVAFNLSRQNAELAESLMAGLSLLEFSSRRNVTLGATRTRLKKLFTHTGTNSQPALVSTLLRAAAIAPRRPG